MKNSECTIYIMFKNRCINKFRKEKEDWILTSSNGTIHRCTAEQMVSHLLQALAGIKDHMSPSKLNPAIRLKFRPLSCLPAFLKQQVMVNYV
jgi:hypothetical protein